MNQNTTTAVVVPERRPMFTRDWNISKQLTRWLMARRVSPNAISLAGMAGGIVAGLALAATTLPGLAPVMFLAAVAGIIVRGMGNLLDGMVAVESGKASPLGELFNEVPDRVSDIAVLIGAGYAAGGNATLGLLAALVDAAQRDVGHVVAVLDPHGGHLALHLREVRGDRIGQLIEGGELLRPQGLVGERRRNEKRQQEQYDHNDIFHFISSFF